MTFYLFLPHLLLASHGMDWRNHYPNPSSFPWTREKRADLICNNLTCLGAAYGIILCYLNHDSDSQKWQSSQISRESHGYSTHSSSKLWGNYRCMDPWGKRFLIGDYWRKAKTLRSSRAERLLRKLRHLKADMYTQNWNKYNTRKHTSPEKSWEDLKSSC